MKRLLQALVLALTCTTAHAGSITYTYHNTAGNDPGESFLVVGEAALFRGEILPGDVEQFQFDFQYRLQDLQPLDITISTATGLPLGGVTLGAQREIVPGIFANLTAGVGPDGGGYWQSSTPGSHDLFGSGFWSVEIAIAPEPSSLVMGCVAIGLIVFIKGAIRWNR